MRCGDLRRQLFQILARVLSCKSLHLIVELRAGYVQHLCHTRNIQFRISEFIFHKLVEFRHECIILRRERIAFKLIDICYFNTSDGNVAAGTYEACAVGGTIGEGEFGIGYDVEMWGQQMVWGTCITAYENSTAGSIEKVIDGTISVEVSGDEYTIILESSVINAKYVGTLTL